MCADSVSKQPCSLLLRALMTHQHEAVLCASGAKSAGHLSGSRKYARMLCCHMCGTGRPKGVFGACGCKDKASLRLVRPSALR